MAHRKLKERRAKRHVALYEGRVAVPISTALYRQRGYQPPLDQLPDKLEWAAENHAGYEPGDE